MEDEGQVSGFSLTSQAITFKVFISSEKQRIVGLCMVLQSRNNELLTFGSMLHDIEVRVEARSIVTI
jgi:hypothetical protein